MESGNDFNASPSRPSSAEQQPLGRVAMNPHSSGEGERVQQEAAPTELNDGPRMFLLGFGSLHDAPNLDLIRFVKDHYATLTFPQKVSGVVFTFMSHVHHLI